MIFIPRCLWFLGTCYAFLLYSAICFFLFLLYTIFGNISSWELLISANWSCYESFNTGRQDRIMVEIFHSLQTENNWLRYNKRIALPLESTATSFTGWLFQKGHNILSRHCSASQKLHSFHSLSYLGHSWKRYYHCSKVYELWSWIPLSVWPVTWPRMNTLWWVLLSH